MTFARTAAHFPHSVQLFAHSPPMQEIMIVPVVARRLSLCVEFCFMNAVL